MNCFTNRTIEHVVARRARLARAIVAVALAGLVTASRSIVNAHADRGGDPATAAAEAAEELRAAAWEL